MSERADILDTVRDAFTGAGDVIFAATLERPLALDYHPGGPPAEPPDPPDEPAEPEESPCRLLFDRSRETKAEYLQGVEIEPNDMIAWLEGASFAPRKADLLKRSGLPTLKILFAEDLLQLGVLHLVVAR